MRRMNDEGLGSGVWMDDGSWWVVGKKPEAIKKIKNRECSKVAISPFHSPEIHPSGKNYPPERAISRHDNFIGGGFGRQKKGFLCVSKLHTTTTPLVGRLGRKKKMKPKFFIFPLFHHPLSEVPI